MSAAVMSAFYEFDDVLNQNRLNCNMTRSAMMGMDPPRKITGSNHLITSQSHHHFFPQQPPPPQMQQQQQQQRFQQQQQQPSQQQQQHFAQQFTQFRTRTGSMSSMNSDNSGYSSSLGSSSSSSSSGGMGSPTHSSASSVISSAGSIPSSPVQDYRKLDRSVSEPVSDHPHYRTLSPRDMNTKQQDMVNNKATQSNINSSRYKTELCRPFEEHGYCKYGDKCQFAHGAQELRSLNRHPKYKTELCRTYHTIGFCPYGPRCHFIHNDEERRLGQQLKMQQQQQGGSNPQSPVVHHGNNQPSLPSMSQAPPPQYPRPGSMARQPSLSHPPPPAPPAALPSQPHLRPKSLNFNLMALQRDTLGSTADSPPSSDTDSPQTLSPTFFGDEMVSAFSPIPPVSAPAGLQPTHQHQHLRGGAPAPSSAFPFHDLGVMPAVPEGPPPAPGLMAPLNVQTEQEAALMASVAAQLQALSVANQRNNNVNCNDVLLRESLDLLRLVQPPPSSPESVTSSSSSDSINDVSASSPLEVSRSLRLPIFSKISNSDDSD